MVKAVKTCQCCGREFVAAHNNMKYCCYSCRRRAENQAAARRYFAAKNRRGEKTLDQKVAEADAMGVSYGKYIIMKKLEAAQS